MYFFLLHVCQTLLFIVLYKRSCAVQCPCMIGVLKLFKKCWPVLSGQYRKVYASYLPFICLLFLALSLCQEIVYKYSTTLVCVWLKCHHSKYKKVINICCRQICYLKVIKIKYAGADNVLTATTLPTISRYFRPVRRKNFRLLRKKTAPYKFQPFSMHLGCRKIFIYVYGSEEVKNSSIYCT